MNVSLFNKRSVRVHSRRPRPVVNKPVFTLYNYNQKPYSFKDIQEIYDLCETIKTPDAREAIYTVHNLDVKMIDKYFSIVKMFERCLAKKPVYRKNKKN